MSAFHKIIANVRSALEQKPAPAPLHNGTPTPAVQVAPVARRTELTQQFARELELVSGNFLGALTPAEARDRCVALMHELNVRHAAVGESVVLDIEAITRAMQQAGIGVIQPARTTDADRAATRERIANADIGIIEADYAIASTGTFAVVATPTRANSLTLLPPANLILVDADRVLPDLAAVISAIGVETVAGHRIALITGPSRTADIEKMIVLGVHGPKKLYAAAVWR